eukprot:9691543-Prorocentrum_lima.AAC.1
MSLDDWQPLEDLQFPCSSMRAQYGERSTTAALEVDRNTNEATAGSGETQAEEPGGSWQGA